MLLAAGADPKLMTATNTTAVMAAAALNHGVEKARSPNAGDRAVQFLLGLGLRAGGVTTLNENAFSVQLSRMEYAARNVDRKRREVNVVSKAGVTPWFAASGYGDRLGGVLYNKAPTSSPDTGQIHRSEACEAQTNAGDDDNDANVGKERCDEKPLIACAYFAAGLSSCASRSS